LEYASYPEPEEICRLSHDETALLVEKILALPERFSGILFFKYVFNADEETTGDILGQANVKGCLAYSRELLASSMKLSENTGIHYESMVGACKAALSIYMDKEMSAAPSIRPAYSAKFRKSLKSIKSARRQRSPVVTIMRRVAVFLLIAFISAVWSSFHQRRIAGKVLPVDNKYLPSVQRV